MCIVDFTGGLCIQGIYKKKNKFLYRVSHECCENNKIPALTDFTTFMGHPVSITFAYFCDFCIAKMYERERERGRGLIWEMKKWNNGYIQQ